MQPEGTPLTPHCTMPLVMAGLRLLRFSGMGVQFCPKLLHVPATDNPPVWVSTVVVAASARLKSEGTQLYTLLYFSCHSPNRLKRKPMLRVKRGVARQSSWK